MRIYCNSHKFMYSNFLCISCFALCLEDVRMGAAPGTLFQQLNKHSLLLQMWGPTPGGCWLAKTQLKGSIEPSRRNLGCPCQSPDKNLHDSGKQLTTDFADTFPLLSRTFLSLSLSLSFFLSGLSLFLHHFALFLTELLLNFSWVNLLLTVRGWS